MRFLFAIVLLAASASAWAQAPADTTYQVEITATASPMINFFRLPRAPGIDNQTSVGYGASLRAMWHPGRLLAIGVLSGYYIISDDRIWIDQSAGDLNYSARLTAIPLQLALSMQKHGLEFGVGIGPYLMMTAIEGGSSPSASGSRLELGMTFFGSYVFALSDDFKIGPELRILSLRYRGIVSLMPSCNFRFDILRY